MAERVPLDLLPPDLRAATPATGIQAYATQLEKKHGLPEGTLASAKFQSAGGDPLGLMQTVAERLANEQQQQPAVAPTAPATPPAATPDAAPTWKDATFPELGHRLYMGLAGAGKSVADTGRGLGQMLGITPQSDIDESARLDQPLMADPYGFAGNVVGQGAQIAVPMSGVAKLGALGKASAATKVGGWGALVPRIASTLVNPYMAAFTGGGLYGAAQPVETGGSRVGQAAVSGVANLGGQVAGEALMGLARPAAAAVSPAIARLAQIAADKGIHLRAADISRSPALQLMQAGLDKMPFSGGAAQRESAQKGFNAALNQTMGQTGDDLGAGLKAARPDLSASYDTLMGRNTAELDPASHGQQLVDLHKAFAGKDTSQVISAPGQPVQRSLTTALDDYLNGIFDPANGIVKLNPVSGKVELPGPMYKKLRSEAAQSARAYKRAANSGNGGPEASQLATFYNGVKETLDDAMRTSSTMTPEDAALLKTTDKQWGNMRTLENLAPKDATGDVDFNALAKTLVGKSAPNVYNRNAFIYGGGDQTLPDLARIGTTFLGRGVPPSSMAPWMSKIGAAIKPVGTAGLGAGLYFGANKGSEHPYLKTAAELGALGLLSKGVGMGANSRWFSRGASPAIQALVNTGAEGVARLPTATADALMRSSSPTPVIDWDSPDAPP